MNLVYFKIVSFTKKSGVKRKALSGNLGSNQSRKSRDIHRKELRLEKQQSRQKEKYTLADVALVAGSKNSKKNAIELGFKIQIQGTLTAGAITLNKQRNAEFGDYWNYFIKVPENQQCRGIARNALRHLIDALPNQKIVGYITKTNIASQKSAQSAGFSVEAYSGGGFVAKSGF